MIKILKISAVTCMHFVNLEKKRQKLLSRTKQNSYLN